MDTMTNQGFDTVYLAKIIHGERVLDIQSAKQSLIESSGDPNYFLAGALDLDRIGVIGWSIGGSAATEICLIDPSFKAGVNLDGYDFARNIESSKMLAPFMFIRSDIRGLNRKDLFVARASKKQVVFMDQRQTQRINYLRDHTLFPFYAYKIKGAFHSNLRDHGLLNIGLLGSIDGAKGNKLLTELVIGFFNLHLKNKGQGMAEIAERNQDLLIKD